MKRCIWCGKSENETPFEKLAHTIPQSLGGKNICNNVCDACNLYFGSHYMGMLSIETVLKETFGITRARFLNTRGEIGKNKALPRYSSVYFNVDFKKHKIALKSAYLLRKGFQENIGRQMKRGLYKIFLEETERQFGTGHDPKYNFIREYARFNLGDFPLFYFERKHGVFLLANEWVKHPVLHLKEDEQMKYLVNSPGFQEFELLGHIFGIATARSWEIGFDTYAQKTKAAKCELFHRWWPVKHFNDVDLALALLDDHYHEGVTEYSYIK